MKGRQTEAWWVGDGERKARSGKGRGFGTLPSPADAAVLSSPSLMALMAALSLVQWRKKRSKTF